VDVIDAMSRQDVLAMNGDVDANLMSEGAGKDSNPEDSGRGRVASVADAEGVQARPLYPHVVQVANHLLNDLVLSDIMEGVVAKTERRKLLWSKICLGALRFDPNVTARARDETGFGGKAIVEAPGLDSRGRVRSVAVIGGGHG